MVSHLVRRATTAAIASTTLILAPLASGESLLDIYEIALDNDVQLVDYPCASEKAGMSSEY